MFTAESGGLVTCSGEGRAEKQVFAVFREHYGAGPNDLPLEEAKILFKVTVEDGSKVKPLVFAGVPQSRRFQELLDWFDQKFSSQGAFLLKAGYGINPTKAVGTVFMKYGFELTYHAKVDFTRLAYAT